MSELSADKLQTLIIASVLTVVGILLVVVPPLKFFPFYLETRSWPYVSCTYRLENTKYTRSGRVMKYYEFTYQWKGVQYSARQLGDCEGDQGLTRCRINPKDPVRPHQDVNLPGFPWYLALPAALGIYLAVIGILTIHDVRQARP
ncbi:MAG: hypothetical protein RDV48_29040 [Candidatus Eremiobacteraeota bacterium]|nr:hypothetical protein [Candidatus Eremiobacteraeota bacterium]